MNKRANGSNPSHWLLPLGIAAAALLLQLSGQIPALRLERDLVLQEPWRLFTGHLIHLSWPHLVMNMAGLAVVWALLSPAMGLRNWMATILVTGAGATAGLLLFSPQVAWYAGFSGILHGMLATGAAAGLKRKPGLCGALLALLALKLVVEQLGGHDPGTARAIGHAVIVDAHLYGAITGLALGAALAVRRRANP